MVAPRQWPPTTGARSPDGRFESIVSPSPPLSSSPSRPHRTCKCCARIQAMPADRAVTGAILHPPPREPPTLAGKPRGALLPVNRDATPGVWVPGFTSPEAASPLPTAEPRKKPHISRLRLGRCSRSWVCCRTSRLFSRGIGPAFGALRFEPYPASSATIFSSSAIAFSRLRWSGSTTGSMPSTTDR